MDLENFDEKLKMMWCFKGKMNDLGNSIDLLLSDILDRLNIKPGKMLGEKINKLKPQKPLLQNLGVPNIDELFDKLDKFNQYWIIAKHGTSAWNGQSFNIHKDGKDHIFDNKKQKEIDRGFFKIKNDLTIIQTKIAKKSQ